MIARTWTLRLVAREESGATLPLVAIMLVVILGMASLTIDLGNGWRIRRALIPATDSAALAAAQDYANGDDGCALSAGSFVTQNESAATMVSCVPQSSGGNGYVTVTAEHNVQTWFAQVIGLGDYTVTSASTAAWSDPSGAYGLRPLGLCLDEYGSKDLYDAIYMDPPPTSAVPVRVWWTKDQPSACGDTEGNWGAVDLDGSVGGGSNWLQEWMEFGFEGLVEFDDHVPATCDGEEHCLPTETGNGLASTKFLMNDLKNSGQYFTVPLFNYVENKPGQTYYHIAGIARVRLAGFKINGSNGNGDGNSNQYIDFLVEPGFVPGVGGGDGSSTGGNKVVSMCAVDGSDTSGCLP